MSLFSSKDTIKSLLINYLIGFVCFIGLLMGVSMIFHDPDSKGVKADGSIDLGLPQTYFEAMNSIGPETMLIAMFLSAGIVYFMTNTRKGIEAIVIGVLGTFLIGPFVTMRIDEALNMNLHNSMSKDIVIEITSRATNASYIFIGNLFNRICDSYFFIHHQTSFSFSNYQCLTCIMKM